MGGGKTDNTGHEEVEDRDEEYITWAAAGPGATDLDWDPRDLLFEFNDENSGAT